MILKTEELEKRINFNFSLIKKSVGEEYWIKSIYFSKPIAYKSLPGTYIYSDDSRYYIAGIGDRGKLDETIAYYNTEDLFFEIYWIVSNLVSINYISKNYIEGQNFRKRLFEKTIGILDLFGDEYSKKGKDKINEILKKNPY